VSGKDDAQFRALNKPPACGFILQAPPAHSTLSPALGARVAHGSLSRGVLKMNTDSENYYDGDENDGRFPGESAVEVRYPRTKQEGQGDRSAWPWLPGSIMEQVGPDEWRVCVEVRELAVRRDGSKPTARTPASRLYYPCCYRDSSEIRVVAR
jgi:hypothetical protein